ncbi:amino acid ABC transporter [Terrihabitans soli]|uniref:Amino acid ABC transporter n=1 Tax=Terrihabitans soli TaxID=708113 RepID=A0A6S6QQS7_9HYPH|nr:amino acid ABC transporter permease [Terrihabitans soli]BCJ89632.1 amino acid ABC transporter [Terrihabitans soli]
MTANAFISLLQGASVTLIISLSGIAIGVPLGLAIALIRWRRVPVLSQFAAVYVSLMRSTPAVTLCLLIFFAVPTLGIEVGAWTAGILTLTLVTSAFNSEVWRAGLLNFSREQLEASRAFGMTPFLQLRRIIFPQLWRTSLPGLVNEATLLIKASPAIAVIGVAEITRAATRIGAQTYEPLPPMLVATGIYVAIILVFVGMQRIVGRYYGPGSTA